ncbi:MAG: DNA alkylation repair protein [Saprospiraceae bacterium]
MTSANQARYKTLVSLLEENASPEDALKMKQYMRNQYDFLGIRAPQRKLLLKRYLENNDIPEGEELKALTTALWQNPYREMQHLAMDILEKKIRKADLSFVTYFENLVLSKSWWDTVDWLATRTGLILLKYPTEIPAYAEKWIASDNIWWQRLAILFQLKYKSKTNERLLFDLILGRMDSKEFFVQKASGWVLREYSKTQPESVIAFIQEYPLPRLTKTEGMKWINKQYL